MFSFKHIKIPFLSLFLLAFLTMPSVSHAGILSFIGDVLSGATVSAEADTFVASGVESNSQNIALLEPAITPDPSLKPEANITIVGNEALLPEVGPSTLAPEIIDNSNGQISIYIVRSGDTLAGIAEMFDVSTNTVLWANDLARGSTLKVGQSLVILPMSGVIHTVVSGDTLATIAKKYGGDITEIASFNDFKISDKLAVGTKVMIPDGEMSFSTRPSTVSSSGTTAKLVPSSGGPEYAGYYQKPFSVGVRTQGLHGYNGVDYGMPVGSPLYAAAAGIVIISKSDGYNGGYGKYVAIQHPNGTQTVYGHMSNPLVSVGQAVTKGQLIGYSGNTGKSTGPHLHFEIRGAKNPF